MKKIFLLFLISIIAVNLGGCGAAMLMGDTIRSSKKDIKVVVPPSTSLSKLKQVSILGLSLNGVDSKGQYIYSVGQGTTNSTIYSDMLSMELLQQGIKSKSISENISDNTPKEKLDELVKNNILVVLTGNLNVSMTSSSTDYLTGGDWAKTGVTNFTLKGIDTEDGSILFMVSAEYGKAKNANEVTKDIAEIYQDILAGNVDKYK